MLVDSGRDPGDVPSLIPPPPAPLVSSAPYVNAYREAYRAEYLPRVTLGARAGYVATSADSLFKRGNSRLLIGPVDCLLTSGELLVQFQQRGF